MYGPSLCYCVSVAILSLVSGIASDFFLLNKCPHILALYAKQFLVIKLFTFDYHENKSQTTVD